MVIETKFTRASMNRTVFCKFRGDGVWCDNLSICSKCGWNPKVELERIEKLKAEAKKMSLNVP